VEDYNLKEILSDRVHLFHRTFKVFNVFKKKTKYIRKTDYFNKENTEKVEQKR
jgi:hypothetical protein